MFVLSSKIKFFTEQTESFTEHFCTILLNVSSNLFDGKKMSLARMLLLGWPKYDFISKKGTSESPSNYNFSFLRVSMCTWCMCTITKVHIYSCSTLYTVYMFLYLNAMSNIYIYQISIRIQMNELNENLVITFGL